jgi:hypothetical protein
MPMLASVHQLFSADQCQAYIHALRWKDRPLQCPRCQSHNVGPWGTYHYRPGVKRYWCHGCRRTFNDLTYTLLAQSKRLLPQWIFTFHRISWWESFVLHQALAMVRSYLHGGSSTAKSQ